MQEIDRFRRGFREAFEFQVTGFRERERSEKNKEERGILMSPEETVDTVVGKKTSGDFGAMEDENDAKQLCLDKGNLQSEQSESTIEKNLENKKESVELNKIRLVYSPFWLKFGPCPPECDKNDLMHAVGSTFKGVIQSKIKGELCRIRDCTKILSGDRVKEEDGLVHGVKDCTKIPSGDRVKNNKTMLLHKCGSSVRDEGFSPNSMKQIHQTAKKGYSEKNSTFLEIVKMRQNYRDIKANLSLQITPIDMEDKSNKNQCVE
ncbi:hypothetical protein Golob_012477, partial [Gossypium lobatum]|nr:hypothetical protein [Gossypium lobatum]